jgi:hypothetical protein
MVADTWVTQARDDRAYQLKSERAMEVKAASIIMTTASSALTNNEVNAARPDNPLNPVSVGSCVRSPICDAAARREVD